MELNVRYRTLSSGRRVDGIGHTVNVSSSGLMIASEQQLLPNGGRVQVALEWPFLLHGSTPLQLIATGRVIRCQETGFAVQIERYQFRTRKAANQLAKAACSSNIA